MNKYNIAAYCLIFTFTIFLNMFGKIIKADLFIITKDGQSFYDIFEFPYVTRPVIAYKRGNRDGVVRHQST